MPRRPRIDMVGYYHIVNRGVEQRIIYEEDEDFETFLVMLCTACKLYNVQLHGYVLMSNHYHLLIETTQENLSKFMKHINASYAIYFNKKYKRSGHLWQGRFKSWYVTDEAYLYTLISYIHNNPVKANIVIKTEEYRYSSYLAFIETIEPIACLKNSFVFTEFKEINERKEFLQSTTDESILHEIKKASNLVVTSVNEKTLSTQRLKEMFFNIKDNQERNRKIQQAIKEGYSQHAIAVCLGFSQPYVNSERKHTVIPRSLADGDTRPGAVLRPGAPRPAASFRFGGRLQKDCRRGPPGARSHCPARPAGKSHQAMPERPGNQFHARLQL